MRPARMAPSDCPSWCRERHADGALVHYGPLVSIEASMDSDGGAPSGRRYVDVQVEAVTPGDGYSGQAPTVFLADHSGHDGAHLGPAEARAVARALIEAADLAEGVSR